MSGLFQHVSDGDQLGTIEIAGVDRLLAPPRETAGFVGVVFQSVRLSFVSATVAEELGFALASRGVAPGIVAARVEEIGERLGIRHLLDRPIGALSAGEACLVAIGAAIVERPVLLLVDEPLADLDDNARDRVVATLGALAHDAGVCVVVAEHAVGDWGTLPDVRLDLRDGGVHRGQPASAADQPGPRTPAPRAGAPSVVVRDLSVSHGDRIAVEDVDLALWPGELVALRGPNGAGKSSLLHALARPRTAGTVVVAGRDAHQLGRRERRGAVALVPEAFDDLLFSTTVEEECRRADRKAERRSGDPSTAELFLRLTSGERVLLDRHPRDLSAGERLCLVLAIQLSARPSLLLVDEPSRGLDADARRLIGDALVEATASGITVVMATHDRDFAARYATRTIRMAAGRILTEIGASA